MVNEGEFPHYIYFSHTLWITEEVHSDWWVKYSSPLPVKLYIYVYLFYVHFPYSCAISHNTINSVFDNYGQIQCEEHFTQHY